MAETRTERVPLGTFLSSGHNELSGASHAAVNVGMDDAGTIRRRPGIQAPTSLYQQVASDKIDGLHVTSLGKVFAAAVGSVSGNRDVYLVNSGNAPKLGSLSGGLRTAFADTEALLVMANGDNLYKVVLSDNSMSTLGGDPPLASSHVVFNNSRLIANDLALDRSKIRFSGLASGSVYTGHEIWNTAGVSGFVSAESRPDPIVAIGTNGDEVWVWGVNTLEVFSTDALLVYARLPTRDYGCVAPYSIVPYDNDFVWLDHNRRIVRSDGRSVQDVSTPIGPVLKALDRVDDCWGFRARVGPGDFLVYDFPSSGVTYALQAGGGWAQWQSYANGQFAPMTISSHAHNPVNDKNLVGLLDGSLGELVDGVADDQGEAIVAHVESGYQDRGSRKFKECERVRVTLERGTVPVNTASPVASLQWSDTRGVWSHPRPLYLGSSGQGDPVITLESLGVYRQRNWRFIFSADVDMALVSIEEDYSIVEE